MYLSCIYRISIVFSLRIVRELWDLGERKEKASSLLKRRSLQKECAMSTIKFGLFIFFEGNNLQKECTYKHYRTWYISPFGRNSLQKGCTDNTGGGVISSVRRGEGVRPPWVRRRGNDGRVPSVSPYLHAPRYWCGSCLPPSYRR